MSVFVGEFTVYIGQIEPIEKGVFMLRLTALLALILLTISYNLAGAKRAGEFDYYVLSLSWSPSWCALKGNAQSADQCAKNRSFGFTLHGLWPQYATGWPSFCQTDHPTPSRKTTEAMADIMGAGKLALHQWDKHGRCTGLSAKEYFTVSREAFNRVNRPSVFRKLLKPLRLPATVIKAEFLKQNPALKAEMLAVSCSRGHFQEVRICLTKQLDPTACGIDVLQDCQQTVIFPPLR